MEVVKTQQQLDIVQAVHVITEIRLRYDSSSNSDRGEDTLPCNGAVASPRPSAPEASLVNYGTMQGTFNFFRDSGAGQKDGTTAEP